MKNRLRQGMILGFVAAAMMDFTVFAEEFDFREGVPTGWTQIRTAGNSDWWTSTKAENREKAHPALRADVSTKAAGKTGELRSTALAAPTCDNVCVSLVVWNESADKQDTIQVIATTNNWVETLLIGEEIPRYCADALDGAWREADVVTANIPGISGRTDFQIGLRAISGGFSYKYMYVREMEVTYRASARPVGMRFADELGEAVVLLPGNTGMWLAVDVPQLPSASDAVVSSVQMTMVRNGESATFECERVGMSETWRTLETVAQVDAGEVFQLGAQVAYSSTTFDILDEDGTAEALSAEQTVPMLGSVWINEISSEKAEIAGSLKRALLSGWEVEFVSGSTTIKKSLGDAFTWVGSTNNGVGFEVREFAGSIPAGTYTVTLYNACGIVEQVLEGVVIGATGSAGYRGNIAWEGENWNWEGASDRLTWSNSLAEETWGERNAPGQGFEVPVSLDTQVYTYRVDGEETHAVSLASVTVTAHFSGTNVVGTGITDASGLVSIGTFEGTHTETDCVTVSTRATAFGWASDAVENELSLATDAENCVRIEMKPSVAVDTFDDGLASYWINTNAVKWAKQVDGGNDRVVSSLRTKAAGTQSRLTVANTVYTRGKRYARVSFETKNTQPTNGKCDELQAGLSVNGFGVGSTPWLFPKTGNNLPEFAKNEWVKFESVMALDDTVGAETPLMFSILGRAAGFSYQDLLMDNLRLSFEDMVTVEGVELSPTMPRPGEGIEGVRAVLKPWGTEAGVSGVEVWFCYRTNGRDVERVKFEGCPEVLTEEVEVELGALSGEFVEDDVLEYWVEVEYDADNADPDVTKRREKRYYPDRSVVDAETGAWMVLGDYGAEPIRLKVLGVQDVWLNEVCPNPQGSANRHFVELAGVTNASIVGWTLEVKDVATGGKSVYTVPQNKGFRNAMGSRYGYFVFGGSGVSGADVVMTSGLPEQGVLTVKDAEGLIRYAVSYSATGEAVEVAGVDSLGVAEGGVLIAVGAGNPANREFEWSTTTQGNASAGAANPGQEMANRGPAIGFFEVVASAEGVLEATGRASDLDKPVNVKFAVGSGEGEWIEDAEGAATFVGLSENTAYTVTMVARDGVGLEASTNAVVFTRLAVPGAPVLTATGVGSVSVGGSVVGQGQGETAMRFERCDTGAKSGWQSAGAWLIDGLGVNEAISVRMQGRNGDGLETAWGEASVAHTWANAPVEAPMLEKHFSRLRISVPEGMEADGNPAGTQYGLEALLSYKNGTESVVRIGLDGLLSATNEWATLPEWVEIFADPAWGAQVDITATNIAVYWVACNGDGVKTSAGPKANTFFEMTLEAGLAEQDHDGRGVVLAPMLISNPRKTPCNVGLYYLEDETWKKATIVGQSAGYGATPTRDATQQEYVVRGVETSVEGTNLVSVLWAARTDLGEVQASDLQLKWVAEDGVAETNCMGTVSVLDTRYPVVESVVCVQGVGPTNRSTVQFTVTFDQAVTWQEGLEGVTVENGTLTGVVCEDSSTSQSETWVLEVTPSLQEGTVSVTSIAGEIALNVYGSKSVAWTGRVSVAYDEIKPTVELSTSVTEPFNGSPMVVTVEFSEAVQTFPASAITVVNGTVSAPTGSGANYTFQVTPKGQGAVTVSVGANKVKDVAGNGNEASLALTRTYDTVAPTVVFSTATVDPFNESPMVVVVEFSEAVTGFALTDLTLVNGTAKSLTGEGANYTFQVTPKGQGAVKVSMAAGKVQDLAGNGNMASAELSRTYDTVKPTCVITRHAPASEATNSREVTFRVKFSEEVMGFELGDVTKVTDGVMGTLSLTGRGDTYYVTGSDLAGDGTFGISVAANVCHDLAGNANVAATAVTYTVDAKAPMVVFSSETPDPFNASPMQVVATFSEPVTGFALSSLTVVNGTASQLSGSGSVYTFRVAPAANGEVSVMLAANQVQDAAGNGNVASEALVRTYDSVAPVVTRTMEPISGTNVCDMVLSYTVTDESSATLQWQLDGGAWSEPLSSETNEYLVRLSGLGTGEHTVATKAIDAAGNSSAVNTATWTIDLTAPSCTVSAQGSGLVKGSATFDILFSEEVRGLTASDLQVMVGDTKLATSAIALTGSGTTYRATVTFTQTSGTVSLMVPARVCTDVAGNGNLASALATGRIDGAKPTIANVVADKTRVKTGTKLEITFDIVDSSQVSNVRVGSVAANPGNQERWRAVDVPAAASLTITAQDEMGNSVSQSLSPLPYVLDNTAPTVTLSGAPSGTVIATELRASALVSDDDPVLEAQWVLKKGGTVVETGAWVTVPASKTLSYARSALQAGDYTLTLSVKDTAGNARTVSQNWTVADSAVAVTVTAGAQTDDTLFFTVQGGTELQSGMLILGTDNGLSATLGAVTPMGKGEWKVAVNDLYGSGTVTLTVPAGVVTDSNGIGNLHPASASAVVSYSTQAPKMMLRCVGRQLNAEEIRWIFESDQALNGLVSDVFSVSRGVMAVAVAQDKKSATLTVTDVNWASAVHTPITVTFSGVGVTDEFGNGVSAMSSTVVDENLLIPAFGGTFKGVFNNSDDINARMVDGAASGESPASATGMRFRTLTYTFGGEAGAVVRRIGICRVLGVATLDGATVTLTKPDDTTWSTTVSGLDAIHSYVDVPDIVAKKVEFSALQSSSASLYINELAVFGCPVAQETQAPVVSICKLDSTPTDVDTVRFEVQMDEDVVLAAGQAWSNVVEMDGLTGLVSVTTNAVDKTFLVTAANLSGNGTISLAFPAGFFVDAVGNESAAVSAETYEVRRDTTPITAVFTDPAANATPSDSCDVRFTLEFSEPVKGLEASDFVLAQGAGTIRFMEAISPSKVNVWVAAASFGSTLQLKLKAGSVSDFGGNVLANDVLSKTYTVSSPSATETALSVTSSVASSGGGSVSPAGKTVVASGASHAVTAKAFTGYAIKTLTVNGSAVSAAAGKASYTHTLSNITADQTVVATFQKKGAVTVTATAGTGGSVSPASASVSYGGSTNVIVTAQPGYTIASVKVGNSAKSGAAGKTSMVVDLANVTANTTVAATFQKRPDVAVSVTSGANGSVSRTGTFSVAYGSTTTLTVTAAPETETMRYRIASVTVNGVARPAAVGATEYTLTLLDVVSAQTVVVTFMGEEKPSDEPPAEDTRFLFGSGTIALPEGTESVRFTDFVVGDGEGCVTVAPVEADAGATTEALWLVVQRELGGAESKIPAVMDAAGVITFDIPAAWDSLFVVGVANTAE